MTTSTLSPPAPGGLRRSLVDALPLFVAIGLLTAGVGLTSTLLGVRAGLEGFRPTVTGLVLSAYYLGFLAGSLLTPATIRRVGHVRAFAGLASLASAAVLVHIVRPEPLTWMTLRALTGLCLAGLFVVCETWLNGAGSNATRGGLLATYMVMVTGGMAAGQLLFLVADPRGFASFVLASVLVSLAVVPVSLATVSPPVVPDPQPMSLRDLLAVAPLGAAGAAISGFTAAAMAAGGAVYAVTAGLGRGGTAAVLFSALLGSLLLQLPLGRWSDRTDRRFVIVLAGVLGALAAGAAAVVGPDRTTALVALTALGGGMALPLYSLSSAHLNDYLDASKVVAGGSRLLLVNGAGAVAGPVVAATAIGVVGPGALFVLLAGNYVALSLFAAYRMTVRPAVPAEQRSAYVPLPGGTSTAGATLAEGAGEELYPAHTTVVPVPRALLAVRERGAGAPVLLVHDPGRDPATWDPFLAPLAIDGFRAVAVRLRGTSSGGDEQHLDDLLRVLRHLHLSDTVLVTDGEAAELAVRLVAEHPDRIAAVVTCDSPYTVLPVEGPSLVSFAGPADHLDVEEFADAVAALSRDRRELEGAVAGGG